MLDDIVWNGESLQDIIGSLGAKLYVTKLPAINKPSRKQTKYSVSGRSGTVISTENAWNDVEISYEIAIANSNPNTVAGVIAEWLYSADGYAQLTDTFDADHYRLGYVDDVFSVENLLQIHGKATIKFKCRPERYLADSEVEIAGTSATLTNSTNHVAKPLITFETTGTPSMMMMTDRATVCPDMYSVPAERWLLSKKKIAYTWTDILINPTSSSYEDFEFGVADEPISAYTLSTGQIIVTNETGKSGYVALNRSVKPNTTYNFHCEVSTTATTSAGRSSNIYICETDEDGYPLAWYLSNKTGSATHSISFKTSADAYWIMVCFGCSSQTDKVNTYSDIQLNAGEYSNYVAYGTSASGAIIIGNIKVGLSDVPNGLTIDCESENIYCGDENCNSIAAVRVKDSSGNVWNVSEDFPYLSAGETATVKIGGDTISKVTIDPRYWEL